MEIEERLNELGIVLPEVTAPLAAYLPYSISENFVYVSGQLPFWEGKPMYTGKIGSDLKLAEGQAAARCCGLNLMAQVKNACDGNLDKLSAVIKLTGYVNSTGDFTEHPKVINGASDLMVEIFGERGKHSRVAVGCNSLPLGCSVEIAGIFKISS